MTETRRQRPRCLTCIIMYRVSQECPTFTLLRTCCDSCQDPFIIREQFPSITVEVVSIVVVVSCVERTVQIR